jgi:hypothetical protein
VPPDNVLNSTDSPFGFFYDLKEKLTQNQEFAQFIHMNDKKNPLHDPFYLRYLTIFFEDIQAGLENPNLNSANFSKQYIENAAKVCSVSSDIYEVAKRYAPSYDYLSESAKRAREASMLAQSRIFRLEPAKGILSPEEEFLRKEGEVLNRSVKKVITDLKSLIGEGFKN